MARIRTIKPEFFQDEQLATCSAHARLLAIAILQLCDSNGVFRNIPMQVHAHAFPWEAEVNSPALLGELEGIGYVKLYRVEGREYGVIPGFRKHQRLTGKEAQSAGVHPTPDKADGKGSDGEVSGCFPGKYLDAQEQGTGNREREQGINTPPLPPQTGGMCDRGDKYAEFDQAWKLYPKRHGGNPKPRAFKAWNARLREGHTAEEMTAGIKRYAAFIRSEGNEGGRYVKQTATFLGPDKCFLDDYSEGDSMRDWMREAM